MNVTISTSYLTVIDDYLSPDEFEAVSDHVASRRYPTRLKFYKSSDIRYAMNNAIHLTGKGHELVGSIALEATRCRVLTQLPAGDVVDAVTRHFDDIEDLLQETVGLADEDWLGYTRGFFRSQAGASLGWHKDEAGYSGAYVFYASKDWEADWGGELCFRQNQDDLSNLSQQQKLDALDYGQCIFPRPNRLVLIRGGTPHRVAPVTTWAKSPRYTVTGFFVNSWGLLEQEQALKQRYLGTSWLRRVAIDVGLRLMRGKA
ncbi:MAG: hypothetical protein GY938_08945 [Ketobacter sp.]|nr:hypothetical protein [Ketobacter sp.]